MNITVILCTYNRCQSLSQALDSVAAQILPDSLEWEVIVVDNNSSDQTREVTQNYVHKHPGRFRYVFEQQQGLSRARNTGIRAARGEILAFMDEDITGAPMWSQNFTRSFRGEKSRGCGG